MCLLGTFRNMRGRRQGSMTCTCDSTPTPMDTCSGSTSLPETQKEPESSSTSSASENAIPSTKEASDPMSAAERVPMTGNLPVIRSNTAGRPFSTKIESKNGQVSTTSPSTIPSSMNRMKFSSLPAYPTPSPSSKNDSMTSYTPSTMS